MQRVEASMDSTRGRPGRLSTSSAGSAGGGGSGSFSVQYGATGSAGGGSGSGHMLRSSNDSGSWNTGIASAPKAHKPASAFSSRTSAMYQELNTLNFNALGLYGRQEELKALKDAFENFKIAGSAHDQLNLILVGGASGTGKTALVKEFYSQLETREGDAVMYAFGRYDAYLHVPHGAFISALAQLCSDIRTHPLYESKTQDAILQAVGADYNLLLDLVPNLGELVYEAGDKRPTLLSNDAEYDMVKSKEKFKFLLRRFMHAICQPEHRVVLFLDDIQWMDPASIQLMEMILNDRALSHTLLIICTYRDDEMDMGVETKHPVSKLIQRVQDKRQMKPTRVLIENLSIESVEALLMTLLKSEDVQELARIAYTRVQGNAFFLIQFLSALRDGGYLRYSIATMKWEWDAAEIKRSTVVANNVLTVLMEKMEKLPPDAKVVLQVVGCLGASFEEDLVTLVVQNLNTAGIWAEQQQRQQIAQRSTTDILTSLEDDGILEAFHDHSKLQRRRSFCFSHSQIGSAAHELMDRELMPKLKLEIGRILYQHRGDIDFNGLLFTIVDLWNEGSDLVTSSKELKVLTDLNVNAGKKALEAFAFGASCNYLMAALDLIPENKRWEEHFELSMDIYTRLIKAEYANGSWDQMREHCQEIIELKGRSVMDKIVAYTAMITLLSTQEHNHIDAISLAVEVLKDLGFKFRLGIAGKFAMIGGLIKTKKLLSKAPLEGLLACGEMKDEKRLVALDIMATVNSSLYGANPDLLLCTVLATLRWSLKYGVSKDTAKCVSFYGLVEMALGNADGGTKACKLAVQLAEQQNLMHSEYSPSSAVYGFVLPWTNPLHICANQLLAGYNAGLETGDLHYGFMNITLFCFFSYCMGKPFSDLEEDMREYARQMKEYNQSLQLLFLSLTWQTILNLMGRCDGDPVILTGEVMEYEDMLQTADNDKCPSLRAQVQCHQLQLAVYYRDFDLAAKLIRPAGSIAMVNPANPIIWRNALFEGIAAFELVGRGQKKWKSTALRAIAKTQKWVDSGNVNCVHILYLLQAEKAAVEKDTDNARQLFEKAIITAARNGYRNDRALATERCAEMYAVLGDEFWFNDYFQRAIDAYREIEAFGKVDRMMEEPRQLEAPKPCFEISLVAADPQDESDHKDFDKKRSDYTTVSELTSVRFDESRMGFTNDLGDPNFSNF